MCKKPQISLLHHCFILSKHPKDSCIAIHIFLHIQKDSAIGIFKLLLVSKSFHYKKFKMQFIFGSCSGNGMKWAGVGGILGF